MKKIVCLISNRASYFRQKVLLEQMNREFDLTLMLTSGVLDKEHETTYDDIMGSRFTHFTCKVQDKNKRPLTNMSNKAAELTRRSVQILRDKPDCVMLLADRWELLPVAMAAAYLNIPIAHIQGFETSGNIDQKVRYAVSALADIHFTSHKYAHNKARASGYKNVFSPGCPSIDMMKQQDIKRSESGNYVISIFHPHTKEIESAGVQAEKVAAAVKDYCQSKNLKLYWFGSNNDPGYLQVREAIDVELVENMVGEDFLRLLANARMIVGNSSAGIRESSYLGVPSVNIGLRQEGRMRGTNCLTSTFDTIREVMNRADGLDIEPSGLFGTGDATPKIIKELHNFLGE